MNTERELEVMERANRTVSDVQGLVDVFSDARSLLIHMPRPDIAKDPKLAAVYQKLWRSIERYTEQVSPQHKETSGHV